MDDDAIAFQDLVDRSLYLVNRGDFDCVGGIYYEYYEGEKPKWYDMTNHTYNGNEKSLVICKYNIPIGCIVLYKKKCLLKVGLFLPTLGMKGNKIGYGEETEVQKRMFDAGYKIGFDPGLKIWHYVPDIKMTMKWQIKSYFVEGRDNVYKYSNAEILFNIIKAFGSCILKAIPRNSYKILFNKKYYWQNLILDTLKPVIRCAGIVYGKITSETYIT